jgi:hypothetical protein
MRPHDGKSRPGTVIVFISGGGSAWRRAGRVLRPDRARGSSTSSRGHQRGDTTAARYHPAPLFIPAPARHRGAAGGRARRRELGLIRASSTRQTTIATAEDDGAYWDDRMPSTRHQFFAAQAVADDGAGGGSIVISAPSRMNSDAIASSM